MELSPPSNESGRLLWIEDMPSTPEANGRTATNAPLLARILSRTQARVAFCEFVGARPTDAKVAAFAFGRARGVIGRSAWRTRHGRGAARRRPPSLSPRRTLRRPLQFTPPESAVTIKIYVIHRTLVFAPVPMCEP
jgi:hypothetical protein